jgi:hypothetical protein
MAHKPKNPVYNLQSGLYTFMELFELLRSPPSIEAVVLGKDHITEEGLVDGAVVGS